MSNIVPRTSTNFEKIYNEAGIKELSNYPFDNLKNNSCINTVSMEILKKIASEDEKTKSLSDKLDVIAEVANDLDQWRLSITKLNNEISTVKSLAGGTALIGLLAGTILDRNYCTSTPETVCSSPPSNLFSMVEMMLNVDNLICRTVYQKECSGPAANWIGLATAGITAACFAISILFEYAENKTFQYRFKGEIKCFNDHVQQAKDFFKQKDILSIFIENLKRRAGGVGTNTHNAYTNFLKVQKFWSEEASTE